MDSDLCPPQLVWPTHGHHCRCVLVHHPTEYRSNPMAPIVQYPSRRVDVSFVFTDEKRHLLVEETIQQLVDVFLQQFYHHDIQTLRHKLRLLGDQGLLFQPQHHHHHHHQDQDQDHPLTHDNSTGSAVAIATGANHAFLFSLRICAQTLVDFSPVVATLLLRAPERVLPLFHQALSDQIINASNSSSSGAAGGTGGTGAAGAASLSSLSVLQRTFQKRLRQKLKVRVENLPPVSLLRKPVISAIRSSDVKHLIQIAGTVVRTGMVKMQEISRRYVCGSAKCRCEFQVFSDPEQGNVLDVPRVCPSEHQGKPCRSTQFEIVKDSRVFADHQVIKVQEQVSKLGVGSIPRSIMVVLEDDLVDSVKAGDHVEVVGILIRCWKPCIKDIRCDLETMVRANSIRIKNATSANVLVTEELKKEFEGFWRRHAQTPMAARNEIVRSICPSIYGLFLVKLAIALTVIGGCSHVDETGMKTRGEPHMLLVGDPGTGKSQFLRFTAELSPRSVLTTGIGTTSAGLTCTAVKDGGEWMLEAGALVLADRSVCCIDEFSSIRSHDRTSIHEAMEQQTLSVAKAGLVCKLNARTTIFAVTNPKGKYDPNADMSVNTAIASPLLSRFDIILVLLDTVNPTWDRTVSSFILQQSTQDATLEDFEQEETSDGEPNGTTALDWPNSQQTSSRTWQRRSPPPHGQSGARPNQTPTRRRPASSGSSSSAPCWSIAKLQAYICYVKNRFQPQLTRSSMLILQRYYQLQRSSDARSASRTTIRLLESLTRIAQAHARLMGHCEVTVPDAIVAVFVMENSKSSDGSSSIWGLDASVLYADFAEDPEVEYALQERLVLEYLGLKELATVDSSEYAHEEEQKLEEDNHWMRKRQRVQHHQHHHEEEEEEQVSWRDAVSQISQRSSVTRGWGL